jgi:hypothetical protein
MAARRQIRAAGAGPAGQPGGRGGRSGQGVRRPGADGGCTPLHPAAASAMKDWLEHTTGQPADPLFPARGRSPHPLTRDAIQARLSKYQQTAVLTCPSLADKKITPHVLRHTRAMRMQRRGVASDASFRELREDGTVRDAGWGSPGPRASHQQESPGQGGHDRPRLHVAPRCDIKFGCITGLFDATEATAKAHQRGQGAASARASS